MKVVMIAWRGGTTAGKLEIVLLGIMGLRMGWEENGYWGWRMKILKTGVYRLGKARLEYKQV